MIVCAVYQLGLGVYFMILRPAVLPEDLRFLGLDGSKLAAEVPRLGSWLDLVFTVLGGQMAAVGVLVIAVALRLRRVDAGERSAILLFVAAGGCSVGSMAAVNFALRSDFRWFLTVPVVLWLLAAGLAIGAPGPFKPRCVVRAEHDDAR